MYVLLCFHPLSPAPFGAIALPDPTSFYGTEPISITATPPHTRRTTPLKQEVFPIATGAKVFVSVFHRRIERHDPNVRFIFLLVCCTSHFVRDTTATTRTSHPQLSICTLFRDASASSAVDTAALSSALPDAAKRVSAILTEILFPHPETQNAWVPTWV
jgi:hypothetical protein